ncbi:MAG: TIGR00282 family metallophosphoesterase [Chloroflexi bacterium]|nr:TIGR00282 family metallophosphoesterase [Chloroflexota bacterium]
MRILMIGDIIGKPGRRALARLLPQLRAELDVDLVTANAENTAGGFGLTLKTARNLMDAGVDVMTSGNHIWDKRDIIPHMDELPLLRPANYYDAPGRGWLMHGDIMVLNLQGRVFMPPIDCPFRESDKRLKEAEAELGRPPSIVLVDFHAEATSEKQGLGWYLDGRVSAVVGTHTHVGTADARVLPGGTAYVSDLGMTGPRDSVIGTETAPVLERFRTGLPQRFQPADGPCVLNSVLIDVDGSTGRANEIVRIDRTAD